MKGDPRERWPAKLCTADEWQRMGARAFSDDGGPFGSTLVAHPARLHWQFLLANFVRHRTWPRGRSTLMDDMRLQWVRLGGGWSLGMLLYRHNRRMRQAGHYEIDLGITARIPTLVRSRADLAEWVLWRLLEVEAHECREYFRIGGGSTVTLMIR